MSHVTSAAAAAPPLHLPPQPPFTFCRCPVGVRACVRARACVCVCVCVESERGAEVTQHIFCLVKNRWPPPVRRRRHKIKERNWEEEESEFRGRISRWSISRRLIIQSGRAGGTFSRRLLPLAAAEHLHHTLCRSLALFKVGIVKHSELVC